MRLTLDIEDEYDFSLLGISCHAKDYRLSWAMNKALDIELEKDKAVFNDMQEEENQDGFAMHSYYDEDNLLNYYLISNKSEGKILVEEYPQFDFIFKLSGSQHDFEILYKKQLIQNIDLVLASIQLDTMKLKSKTKLVF